jgi:hypothetical protein
MSVTHNRTLGYITSVNENMVLSLTPLNVTSEEFWLTDKEVKLLDGVESIVISPTSYAASLVFG